MSTQNILKATVGLTVVNLRWLFVGRRWLQKRKFTPLELLFKHAHPFSQSLLGFSEWLVLCVPENVSIINGSPDLPRPT